MRTARTLLALAALCTAAACADGSPHVTAPDAAARSATGGWVGSDNRTGGSDDSSSSTTSSDTATTSRGGGNWVGSNN